jgi:hypothetical protein
MLDLIDRSQTADSTVRFALWIARTPAQAHLFYTKRDFDLGYMLLDIHFQRGQIYRLTHYARHY